jgi:hypothetical protein
LGSLKGRDHTEGLSLDGRIILKWFFREIYLMGVDWINVA